MSTIRKILAVMVIAALLVSGTALAEEVSTITAHDYLGEWVDQDGTTNIDVEAREEGNGYIVTVHHSEDTFTYIEWAYGCVYDEETQTMKCFSRATGTGDYEPDSEDEIVDVDFEYEGAEFRFDENGMLVWDDEGLEEDDGMLFEHTIGWIDPDYVGPGHHFVGEWSDGRVSISIKETMEDYQVIIAASGSAFDGAYWAFSCDYDAETDCLVSNGEVAQKVEYAYSEDGEEYSEEVVYEDDEAMLRLNEEGKLLWYEKKEDAGAGRVFEFVPETETGNAIEPADPGYDLAALGDGEYPVAFAPEALAEGELTLSIYSEDIYDIVDISEMAEGDIFWLGGLDFEVESLEREDDLLLINGGNENNGFTLRAYDEDNGWKVVMDDDYHTYTNRGETALPLDENVTFTDGWDGGETTATGAEAVAEAIASTEMEYFSPLNTTVRVEDGRIVEIVRVYLSILDETTGKIITPNNPEIDIEALADGIYPVAFEFDGLADGDLTFTVYWEDSFDTVEINELAAGDTLYVNDTIVEVETVEKDDDDLLINGGLDNGGVTLRAYDEDNVWKAVLEDDTHTYFNWGETSLPLADDVTFTDGWDIEKEPVTVTGAEAVAEAIAGTEMDAFIPQNTTVRVEDGKIVEIIREYMP